VAIADRSNLRKSECDTAAGSQFKRVRGPIKTIESICMKCLLAVGVRPSERELTDLENLHACNKRSDPAS
jgi:hypothetical protein